MGLIKFGPAGLGPVNTAEETLEKYKSLGFEACEIAFTYGIYIKNRYDAERIKNKAKECKIKLSIHSPYYINLNSEEIEKRESSKKRIIDCCEIGEALGATAVVFHPGFYGKNKESAFKIIKKEVMEIMKEIKKNKWKIKIAAETTGKINVFGSLEEIHELVKETGCSFCIDFAHILAREKIVKYEKIFNLFKEKEVHCHFSGIEYGDKGEKSHKKTKKEEWEELLTNLPKDRDITIINESPYPIEDSILGIQIYNKEIKRS